MAVKLHAVAMVTAFCAAAASASYGQEAPSAPADQKNANGLALHGSFDAGYRFRSLDGSYDTGTLYPILDDPQVMGMMFKTYDGAYKGRDGALDWHNGKPILSVKYSLWDGVQSAREIADALNASTHRDAAHDSESYSIVNVHPWSTLGPTGTGAGDPMSNLNQLVNWLDPTGVKVVTLEELMVHLRKNFGTPP